MKLPKILQPFKSGKVTRKQAKEAVRKFKQDQQIKEIVRKVLHRPGSSKAAKTARGSALSQK